MTLPYNAYNSASRLDLKIHKTLKFHISFGQYKHLKDTSINCGLLSFMYLCT